MSPLRPRLPRPRIRRPRRQRRRATRSSVGSTAQRYPGRRLLYTGGGALLRPRDGRLKLVRYAAIFPDPREPLVAVVEAHHGLLARLDGDGHPPEDHRRMPEDLRAIPVSLRLAPLLSGWALGMWRLAPRQQRPGTLGHAFKTEGARHVRSLAENQLAGSRVDERLLESQTGCADLG